MVHYLSPKWEQVGNAEGDLYHSVEALADGIVYSLNDDISNIKRKNEQNHSHLELIFAWVAAVVLVTKEDLACELRTASSPARAADQTLEAAEIDSSPPASPVLAVYSHYHRVVVENGQLVVAVCPAGFVWAAALRNRRIGVLVDASNHPSSAFD